MDDQPTHKSFRNCLAAAGFL